MFHDISPSAVVSDPQAVGPLRMNTETPAERGNNLTGISPSVSASTEFFTWDAVIVAVEAADTTLLIIVHGFLT